MKRASSIIMLVLLSTLAYAANIYPVDFSKQEEVSMDLTLREGVEFLPIKGIMILNAIKEDGSVDLKLVLPDGRVWGLVPLKKLSITNVDVDRDNDNDISLLLQEVNGDKAKIIFKEVRDDVEQDGSQTSTIINANEQSDDGTKITGSAVSNTGSKTIGVLIIIGIIVVGVVIYFLFARGKTNFGSYQ